MTLTMIAARLREVAAHIETVAAKDRETDVPDEFVPKFVMNGFVDDELIAAFGSGKHPEQHSPAPLL